MFHHFPAFLHCNCQGEPDSVRFGHDFGVGQFQEFRCSVQTVLLESFSLYISSVLAEGMVRVPVSVPGMMAATVPVFPFPVCSCTTLNLGRIGSSAIVTCPCFGCFPIFRWWPVSPCVPEPPTRVV